MARVETEAPAGDRYWCGASMESGPLGAFRKKVGVSQIRLLQSLDSPVTPPVTTGGGDYWVSLDWGSM